MKNITILLKPKENIKFNINMSSLFHGYLMEVLTPTFAKTCHEDGYKPFTQYIVKSEDESNWLWSINTLNDESEELIIKPFLNGNIKEVELKNKSAYFNIEGVKEDESVDYNTLVRNFYLNNSTLRNRRLTFITPCSFKSKDDYVFYPDLKLIYQSLMNKFDSFAGNMSIKDEEVLNHLSQYTKITSYRLRSTLFHLEGVKIPSFMGEIFVRINGPETLANLANLLLYFGNWAGVGIKTSLGMGAIKCE